MFLITLLISFLINADDGLNKKDMEFLSESTAKSLKGCEKIKGTVLTGESSFSNKSSEPIDKKVFLEKIKNQLKKNLGTRFGSASPKEGEAPVSLSAVLESSATESGGQKTSQYILKLSFTTPQDVLCQAENSLSKTTSK